MNNLENMLKVEILLYLNAVNKSNFFESYDGLVAIIFQFKALGLSKDAVKDVVCEICKMQLNDWQDEVIMEISNRLYDYCSPCNSINW